MVNCKRIGNFKDKNLDIGIDTLYVYKKMRDNL